MLFTFPDDFIHKDPKIIISNIFSTRDPGPRTPDLKTLQHWLPPSSTATSNSIVSPARAPLRGVQERRPARSLCSNSPVLKSSRSG